MDHSTRIFVLLVFGFTISVSYSQNSDLVIIPIGDSQTKPIGDRQLFTCSVVNTGEEVDPDLRWFNPNGEEITDETGRLYIERDGKLRLKLYITSIMQNHAGEYSCRGRLDGNMIEKNVKLLIFEDIEFVHAPTPQNPPIYTDSTIACRVAGTPTPQVTWRYEGVRITPDVFGTKYQYTQEGLKVMNISKADDGKYTCRAEVASDGRYDQIIIHVIVHIPPKITRGIGQESGVENQEKTIECRATGLPDPKYEFYKDGSTSPLSSTERREVDGNAGNINFRPLHREDKGEYTCKAVNNVGEAEEKGNLHVIVPPFIKEFINATGVEGAETTLTCHAEGDPPPTLTFRKAGSSQDYVNGANEGGRITVSETAERQLALRITSLSPSDTANYTCKGRNTGGEHQANGTIVVQYEPRFGQDFERNIYSWAGKLRNITCIAQGEPEPNVDWKRFGQLLFTNETYKVHKMGRINSLQVRVRDEDQGWIYGAYNCEATNIHGTRVEDVNLVRASIPEPPVAIITEEMTSTVVVMKIKPPKQDGGVPVRGYRVEYHGLIQDFDVGLHTPTRRHQSDTILIENLKPSTSYLFRIRAKNEVGVSNAIDYQVNTQDVRVPYAINVIANREGIYPFKFILRWDKPRTGGLAIVEYEIKYRRVSVKTGTWEIIKPLDTYTNRRIDDDENAPRLSYELESLNPSTYYQVEFRARNQVGWSAKSAQYVFKTKAVTGTGGNVGEITGSGSMATANQILVAMATMMLLLSHCRLARL